MESKKLSPPGYGRGRPASPRSGFSLMETITAAAITVIACGGMMHSMILFNRNAALSRIQTNARAVVQRNIEQALTEKFTIQTTPAILEVTTGNQVWDDDGGGDNKVSVLKQNGTGTTTISGTLTRNVTEVTNAAGAVIHRITFTIQYAYRGKNYTFSATALRSRD